MSIRIERIQVNRDGPLQDDFLLEPASFNLVFGRNETGKTYLVEAIIKMLFGVGKHSPFKGILRPWEARGAIRIAGLPGCVEAVSFAPSPGEGEQFGSYFEGSGTVLPPDFAKLLVVRAGETHLSGSAGDGVGEDILKNCLSGEGLLDELEGRILATIQSAEISDDDIVGHNKGPLRDRAQSIAEREALEELLERVNQRSFGDARSLAQAKVEKEEELAHLDLAKRYHANCLQEQVDDLERSIGQLPGEQDLGVIEGHLRSFREKVSRRQEETERLAAMAPKIENLSWVSQAIPLYADLIGRDDEDKDSSRPLFLVLALFAFADVVACGFFGQLWGLGLGAIFAVIFGWLYLRRRPREDVPKPGEVAELERLQTDYESRFGETLANLPVIRAREKKLTAEGQRADVLRENLRTLESEISSARQEVESAFRRFAEQGVPEEHWDEQLASWRRERQELDKRRGQVERQLVALQVPPDRYLADNPELEWNSARAKELTDEISGIELRISEEEDDAHQLRADVAGVADLSVTDPWSKLLDGLERKRREVARTYKEQTAEIIGKKCVHLALAEASQGESERIANNLLDPRLNADLLAVTGSYDKLRRSGDGILRLRNQREDEFDLSMLSTGAKEQVMLALRVAFASKVLGDAKAFLILDDAFQHADWDRREAMVDHTLQLVKDRGWQVFYFTMDNHLRDLFRDRAAAILPEDHRMVDLAGQTGNQSVEDSTH